MSKLIISHDIDHLSSWEHLSDLILPKFLIRATIELQKGFISKPEYFLRIKNMFLGKWQFAVQLAEFNRNYSIKSTYFFATYNGIGLAYKFEDAIPFIVKLSSMGNDIALHGISRGSVTDILKEKHRFESLSGISCRGIRLHYLFPNDSILPMFAQAGFIYDSSIRGSSSTKKVGNMIHFPVHIMDGDILLNESGFQDISAADAIKRTREIISRLVDQNVDYISLLFHDRYFSCAHKSWYEWYMETIDWIYSQKLPMCSYEDAVQELKMIT